ncbi:MAG: electron transport complex subunit RsxC [candidate division WOR-3 bacterium]|jgi:electron transport complex protein RnfC|nr:electron transport complex subunit RsxC [candidate division WOR-3 bacterium]MCR4423486.1 electron transport complex subunit RsxC [candidate division WOR-3 bacterium]MDH7518825.1 electron transport complex subunit RsxC [bacterium]
MDKFRGGIHPREHKEATEFKPIEAAPLPQRVVIPLSQHTGAPSKPVVKPGDAVRTGTIIAEPGGNLSVPTHSSISGTVSEVKELPHPLTSRFVTTVIIESDQQDTLDENIKERDLNNITPDEIITAIRNAGIVGLGGAAFPTFFKLTPPKDKVIDTLIINGCECEPYLTADHRLMVEKPAEIVEGTTYIARALGVKNVLIAIEDNKPDAIAAMKEAVAGTGFVVRRLKTKYPQGAEKQLIKACLEREVPSGGLPADVGCIVQNVGTAFAVREAVRFNRPLYERVVTVTGSGISEPKNLLVRIGTPVKDLINFCGGYKGTPEKLIMGGPMMGITLASDEVPVLKGTSGILVFLYAQEPEEQDCIRCGRCIEACPMGLSPTRLNYHIKSGRLLQAKNEHLLDCIECGCCAFVCPAKIRLVHNFKYGKSEILRARERG